MNKKILFAHIGGHPVHRKFAGTITKNFVRSSWNLPKNYDVYFIESGFIKAVLLRMLGKINKRSKLINLFADPRLFYLNKKIFLDIKKDKVKKYPGWKLFLSKILIKKLDGAICVGKFEEELLRKITKKVPSEVVYPFPTNERYKKLIKITPSLSKQNILFIGNGPDYYYKGVDILIDVFKDAKKRLPNLKLYLLGDLEVRKEWKIKDVYFEGRRNNLSDYLKKASLYMHLGRGEAFAVSILEAMLAGIPVIVSEYTGPKEAVEKVDKKFIVPLNKKIISNKVIEYFSLSLKKKREILKKCKKVSREFNEENMLKIFKEKFQKIVKELYKDENPYHK